MPYVIKRFDLEALPSSLARTGALPDFPVVYLIFDGAEVFYVGATKSLYNRWSAHRNNHRIGRIIRRRTSKVGWIKVPVEQLPDFESALIQFFRPKFNTIRQGKTYFHANHGVGIRKNAPYSRLLISDLQSDSNGK